MPTEQKYRKDRVLANPIAQILAIGWLGLATLVGCTGLPDTPTSNPPLPFTQAAETILAQFTEDAALTPTAILASPTPAPTSTSRPTSVPSSTPQATAMPSPTPQVIVVTATPNPLPPPVIIVTATPLPYPTSTPALPFSPCDWAQLVSDVTFPKGSILMPGTSFVKIWRLRNIGTCTWTPGFTVLFVDGYRMGSPERFSLPDYVYPGQTIDLAIPLTAPDQSGNFRGSWLILNDQGVPFGLGDQAADPFNVSVKVILANPNYAYDFTANVCQANWESATGNLACPGTESAQQGFVLIIDNPPLENQSGNLPALWTHPNYAGGGWISGSYPAIVVPDSSHFKAWLGCLNDNPGCNVDFTLN
jgi:hypothetical protein